MKTVLINVYGGVVQSVQKLNGDSEIIDDDSVKVIVRDYDVSPADFKYEKDKSKLKQDGDQQYYVEEIW